MRFLFVDRITECGGDSITGCRRFAADEPMQYRHRGGGRNAVAPGAISEAIGQLASWGALLHNDFRARPVFLFAESIVVNGMVRPGQTVDLEANIEQLDEESLRFSGVARIGERVVQTIEHCSGAFMPLAELEDPRETRRRCGALRQGCWDVTSHGAPYEFDGLIDEVFELEPGERVVAAKVMNPSEPFYHDHFPRFPVTPVVILNEMVGRAAARLAGSERALQVQRVEQVKIRKFVRPGETCLIKVRKKRHQGTTLTTLAEIEKNGERILRGQYEFALHQPA